MEVEWRRLRADQLRECAKQDAIVILPVGSLEQHGPHLPVEIDSLLGEAVALRTARLASATDNLIVLPMLWTGISEHHMSLGGTITLDFETFFGLIRCVCESVVRHGFRRIVLLNAHGGNQFPVMKDISKVVFAEQGNMKDTKRVGSVIYNLGVVNGILNVEAVRIAQGRFGHRALSGEEVAWGFDHLDLDDKRIAELGGEGLVEPIKVTCSDHEGGGSIKIQQWDGASWERSDRLDRGGPGPAAPADRGVVDRTRRRTTSRRVTATS